MAHGCHTTYRSHRGPCSLNAIRLFKIIHILCINLSPLLLHPPFSASPPLNYAISKCRAYKHAYLALSYLPYIEAKCTIRPTTDMAPLPTMYLQPEKPGCSRKFFVGFGLLFVSGSERGASHRGGGFFQVSSDLREKPSMNIELLQTSL